ncbi:MAG: hypothetical protein KKF54_06405 [Candidatus Omnitrophica bacterium]|nr:hypothetical protein [Candidatus Omnitrophota bacterium]
MDENSQLSNIIAAQLLTVKSDYFSAKSIGQIKNKNDFRQIRVVFARDNVIKYWDED